LRDRLTLGIFGRMAVPVVATIVSSKDRRALFDHSESLLAKHFQRLGSRPVHGNRKVTDALLFKALLLSFFDPMTRSLRKIEDRGNFGERIELSRLARSTTADALCACDPTLLLSVIQDLRVRTPQLGRVDPSLLTITRQIIAADGTYLNTLADVAFALKHTQRGGKRQGQVRANVQIDVDSWAPQVISVSGDDKESEPAAFGRDLLEGVLYVFDRNFLDFCFISRLLAKGNDFVLRARANAPAVRVVRQLTLVAADVEAGVTDDQIVELTGRDAPRNDSSGNNSCGGYFRLVTIKTIDRNGEDQIIRLLTNLTDAARIAAHLIGAIYRLRWQIELFFKWFKTFARLDHLLSTSRRGITYQLYVAIIGVLLMVVQSGRRVSTYALAVFSYVAAGTMSLSEAMAVIEKRNREREMDRLRQARRRAAKKLV
jgi:hypothetical protein